MEEVIIGYPGNFSFTSCLSTFCFYSELAVGSQVVSWNERREEVVGTYQTCIVYRNLAWLL